LVCYKEKKVLVPGKVFAMFQLHVCLGFWLVFYGQKKKRQKQKQKQSGKRDAYE